MVSKCSRVNGPDQCSALKRCMQVGMHSNVLGAFFLPALLGYPKLMARQSVMPFPQGLRGKLGLRPAKRRRAAEAPERPAPQWSAVASWFRRSAAHLAPAQAPPCPVPGYAFSRPRLRPSATQPQDHFLNTDARVSSCIM